MPPNMSGAPMWDKRYATDGYLFGTEPAAFLTTHAEHLAPGSNALVVADGEGRNSLYLAELGLDVTAMDISSVGVDKARKLAAERELSANFLVADIMEWQWEPAAYDVVVAVFIQFLDPLKRSIVFDGMQRTLRPGGRLLLHGYRPEQVGLGTGGPPIPENMYTDALLADEFADMEIETLRGYDAVISEGDGHAGMSALIDLIATKRDPR